MKDRKKLLCLVTAALLGFLLLSVLLCSCSSEPEIGLTYHSKYIMANLVNRAEKDQCYLIFQPDGTGTYYHNYWGYEAGVEIRFRYLFEGDFIVCFYDSLVSGNLSALDMEDGETWYMSYYYSKRMLMMRTENIAYICEDYMNEIPNFGGMREAGGRNGIANSVKSPETKVSSSCSLFREKSLKL